MDLHKDSIQIAIVDRNGRMESNTKIPILIRKKIRKIITDQVHMQTPANTKGMRSGPLH